MVKFSDYLLRLEKMEQKDYRERDGGDTKERKKQEEEEEEQEENGEAEHEDEEEKERAEREKAEKEQAEKEKAEKERTEKEKAEKEKAAREQAEKEKAEKERAEKEREEKEKAAKSIEVEELPEKEKEKESAHEREQTPEQEEDEEEVELNTSKGKAAKGQKGKKRREKEKEKEKEKERERAKAKQKEKAKREQEGEEEEQEEEEVEDDSYLLDEAADDIPVEKLREMIETLDEDLLDKKGLPPPYVKLTRFMSKTKSGTNDIKIDNINISVPGAHLLVETSLTIAYGRKYGLVGRNYTGKSTLMRAMAERRLSMPKHLTILLVEQEVPGDDIPALQKVLSADKERAWLEKEEKIILAERYEQEQEYAAEEQGAEVKKKTKRKRRYYTLDDIYERLKQIDADRADVRATNILLGLGFSKDELSKPTKDFSGGWRMRIALAGALFFQPDILMLDEPTNHLDLYALVWLENYLVEKWKKTLLIASHERDFLNNVVDGIIHLYQQKLTVYSGNYEKFHKSLKANQSSQNAKIQKQEKQLAKMKESIKTNKNQKSAAVQQKKMDKIEKVQKYVEDKLPRFSFPDPIPIQYPILTFTEVEFGFDENKPLLKDLDFGIDLESRIGLVGPNGAGKSTLMNLMNGVLKPTKGLIHRNHHLKMAKFTQHHVEMLDLEASAIEHLQKKFPNESVQEIRNHLARFGVTGQLPTKQIKFLSGGQKSRVSFAEIAWNDPHILLLDEPSNHLDMETVDCLAKSLKEYKGGIVLISHSTRLLSRVCDQIWVVKDGYVKPFNGSFDEYKQDLIEEMSEQMVHE